MTAGEYAWDYGFEVFNVYCSGQKTKLQVMVGSELKFLLLTDHCINFGSC